jgi:hypothetical protein
MMSGFEVMPVGAAARLTQLEAEVERLREKLLIACNRGDVADAEVGRLQAEVERLRDSCAAKADRIDRLGETVERLRAERDHARACVDNAARLLTSIHSLLYPAPLKMTDGRTMVFRPENPHDYMQALSDRIRALPDELAAIKEAQQAEPQWCACEPTRCEGMGQCRWQAMKYVPPAQQAEVEQDELHAEAILQALIAEWEAKAATWLHSPEAAQGLHGYRDLAKRLATTELKAEQMRELIADDSHAASFQSLGQYRTALLRAIKEGQ